MIVLHHLALMTVNKFLKVSIYSSTHSFTVQADLTVVYVKQFQTPIYKGHNFGLQTFDTPCT